MGKFGEMAERARLAAQGDRKTSPAGDGGLVLEKAIPMPEIGIGVSEYLADRRERREVESRSFKEGQEKQEAQRKADMQASDAAVAHQVATMARFQKMAERARQAVESATAIIEAQRFERERDPDNRGPWDRGPSI